jgi:acyl-CoA thioester hydrolase/thioesterase-3
MNSIFASEIKVRPDDIDMNNHVHNTKYLDYVQTARFEQMRDFYKMPMEDYHSLGLNWFASLAHIEYKRQLKLNDIALVKTQMGEVNGAQCRVNFWIANKTTSKLVAEGYFIYTLISLESGRPVRISDEIIQRHSI